MNKIFHFNSCQNCKNLYEFEKRSTCFPRVKGYGCKDFIAISSPLSTLKYSERIKQAEKDIKEYINAIKRK